MWVWIKSHKVMLALLAGGAIVLYYAYQWYQSSVAANTATQQDIGAAGLATADLSAYGSPAVAYSGGGVPVANATASAAVTPAAPAPAPVAAPAAYNAPPTVDPSTIAAPGTSPFNPTIAPGTAPPTGPGWNQGTQPGPTLGEGGTALPVASGDFTNPVAGEPGVFTNAQGYSSQASLAANAAAVSDLEAAWDKGYVSTGGSALSQLSAILSFKPAGPGGPVSYSGGGIPAPTGTPIGVVQAGGQLAAKGQPGGIIGGVGL